MTTLIDSPVLRFAVHENGSLEHLGPWFPWVAFSQELLATADGRRLALKGGDLTITCTNGGAVYALGGVDALGVRAGRLLRSW